MTFAQEWTVRHRFVVDGCDHRMAGFGMLDAEARLPIAVSRDRRPVAR